MNLADATLLARRLMDAHGLAAWDLVLDGAKTRAGICRFDRQVIGLSRPLTLLHDETDVRDTILHEIAHALVGPEHGHDAVWRARARAIGSSGTRCATSSRVLPGDWVGRCPAGHVTYRHRRPSRLLSCAVCRPRFDPEVLYAWTYRGQTVPMGDRYVAELAGLRWRYGREAAARGLRASAAAQVAS